MDKTKQNCCLLTKYWLFRAVGVTKIELRAKVYGGTGSSESRAEWQKGSGDKVKCESRTLKI